MSNLNKENKDCKVEINTKQSSFSSKGGMGSNAKNVIIQSKDTSNTKNKE